MKTTYLFLIILMLISCSIKQVCHINNKPVIIIKYNSWGNTWIFESIKHDCYFSGYCENCTEIKDTVLLQYVEFCGAESKRPSTVKIIKKY